MSRRRDGPSRRERHDSGVSSLSSHSRGGPSPPDRAGIAGRNGGAAPVGRGGHNNLRGGRNPRISNSNLTEFARVCKSKNFSIFHFLPNLFQSRITPDETPVTAPTQTTPPTVP